METSILNILREELIGKEIKIYKYNWGLNGIKYYYEEQDAYYTPDAYLGYRYVKITSLKFDWRGQNFITTLILKESKFITISSMDIEVHSRVEFKEKGD